MKHPEWTEADSRKCKQIWAEYQKQLLASVLTLSSQ